MDLNDRFQIDIRSTQNKRLARLLQQKIDSKTKPLGALGFLEELALQIGLIQKSVSPRISKPTLLILASDHGITDSGVSRYSKKITYRVVLNFLHEGAAINVFARNSKLGIRLVDVGVDHSFEGTLTYWLHHGHKVLSRKISMGTRSFLDFPAMTTAETERALAIGQRLVQDESQRGCNTIGLGDIAVGNFSSAVAITCAILEMDAEAVVSEPAPSEEMKTTLEVVGKALRKHPKTHDPLTILALYGGFEIATMAGAILKAAQQRMVVLVDGYIGTVALMVAHRMAPEVVDYCIICQHSGENAHQLVLDHLKKRAILGLNINLGEGCGVALALPIIKNSIGFLSDMSSFDEAILDKPID